MGFFLSGEMGNWFLREKIDSENLILVDRFGPEDYRFHEREIKGRAWEIARTGGIGKSTRSQKLSFFPKGGTNDNSTRRKWGKIENQSASRFFGKRESKNQDLVNSRNVPYPFIALIPLSPPSLPLLFWEPALILTVSYDSPIPFLPQKK